jgi:hypothetical protein
MIHLVFHLSIAAWHYGQLAQAMRRTLDELPDAVLKDIGLARSEISFFASDLVSKPRNLACNTFDRFDWNAVWRSATILRVPETVLRLTLVAAAAISAVFVLSSSVLA